MNSVESVQATEEQFSLAHLNTELARMDILMRCELRRMENAGQNPRDDLRGLYLTVQNANALLNKPLAASWGQTASLSPEETEQWQQAYHAASIASNQILEKAVAQNILPRLARIARLYALSQFELDLLLICLAPAIDLKYETLYGFLQDNLTLKYPSVQLVLNILASPGLNRFSTWRFFDNRAPLFFYNILQKNQSGDRDNLLSQSLQIDPQTASWLLCQYTPPVILQIHSPALSADEELLLEDYLEKLKTIPASQPTWLSFSGTDISAQEAAAHWISVQTSLPLLSLDFSRIGNQPVELTIRKMLRDSRLTRSIAWLKNWDAILDEQPDIAQLIFDELGNHPALTILSGKKDWRVQAVSPIPVMRISFHPPGYLRRLELWKRALPENAIPLKDMEYLAGVLSLSPVQIRSAAAEALQNARQTNIDLQPAGLFSAARASSQPIVHHLARHIRPRYTWDDLILPAEQTTILGEIVQAVRGKARALEVWGVNQKLAASNGLTLLFAGPPGTGKTMAAEVIANDLNLDLIKIDLSAVVSKYIGETEKNLSQVFDAAENSSAILFFDEADSLFGKRSEVKDAHDRYANIETSYLLQRMETYNGITILATNLRANIDEAFTRRLHFVVDFPFPEEKERLRIWQTLFPVQAPHESNLDFHHLARRYKLAGGNIRNILVNAAYLSAADGGVITMNGLLHSVRRELQKMGRLVAEEDQNPRN